jgi:HNH endonuclease
MKGYPVKIKPTEKLSQKFWKHVNKTEGCWLWKGGHKIRGYGYLLIRTPRWIGAHRYSYLLHHGEIPKGLVVMHKCDNPTCVHPEHLTVGTQDENIKDMIKKGRQNYYGRRKLTLDQMEAIRKEYVPGKVTHQMLADKYGVCRANISYIIHGKSWGLFPEGANLTDQRRSLSPDQIQEIRSLQGKKTSREVGKKFGVGKSTILRHWSPTSSPNI